MRTKHTIIDETEREYLRQKLQKFGHFDLAEELCEPEKNDNNEEVKQDEEK